MGLSQGDVDHHQTGRNCSWIVPGAVLITALVLALMGDTGRELLRYDRIAIADGEGWRLISGHIAHLGWSHFALNAAGLLLIFYLVGQRFTNLEWLIVSAVVIVGIDLGFWLLEPQLFGYVGLSGLLHGYLAAGAIAGIRTGQIDYWLIIGFLVIKLGYEQIAGPLPGSESSTGGTVIVAAHLYGAIAGLLTGAVLSFRKAAAAPI
jgi:rhomboid family GlyGly-CTERM serine protease